MNEPDRQKTDAPGQWVLVTGAASGIGRAVVERLAASGVTGVGVDLKEPPLHTVPGWNYMVADVSSEESVTNALQGLMTLLPAPWGLVNCAGILGDHVPLLELNLAQWSRIMAVNLTGCFNVCRQVTSWIIDQRGGNGSIVNVASQLSVVVNANEGAYCVSKAAVVQLTRALALEMAPLAVRVNAVSPGVTDTPLLGEWRDNPGWLEEMVQRIPLGRLGSPAEIARVIEFCLDPSVAYMTGANVVVDGGWILP